MDISDVLVIVFIVGWASFAIGYAFGGNNLSTAMEKYVKFMKETK
jgi:hypothetical protein